MSDQHEVDSSFFGYYGVSLPKLKDGSVALGAMVLIKVMDEEGGICYHEFASGVMAVEQLGMLETASDTVRAQIMGSGRRLK